MNTTKKTMLELLRNVRKKEGRYSIEVEAEFKDAYFQAYNGSGTKNMMVKGDPSLVQGYEFISAEARDTVGELVEDLETLFKKKVFQGYIESERTSTHVHVNIQDRTPQEVLVMLAVYWLVEGLMIRFCGKLRDSNMYCLPLWDAESVDAAKYLMLGEYDVLSSPQFFNQHKYAALNTAAIGSFGSLEFRALYGTKDIRVLQTWLQLIERISNSFDIYRDLDEVWQDFDRDRVAFAQKVFGPMWPVVSSPYVYEDLERNYSRVFTLICYPNKYKKQETVVYKFHSELDEDDLQFDPALGVRF